MSERKRVNISIDPQTYEKLKQLTATYKFKNVCELLVSFAHILLDRMEGADKRKYDLPEPDGAYIDSMFEELGGGVETHDTGLQISNYTKKKVKSNGKR